MDVFLSPEGAELAGGIDAKENGDDNPALMVVDGDPGSLATLDDTLRRRYGHDCLIISEATPGTALGRLRELRDAGRWRW